MTRRELGTSVSIAMALQETEDHLIANEEPEVIAESLKVVKNHFGVPQSAVAREMRVQPSLLQTLLMSFSQESVSNVVNMLGASR
jgi:predicted transcriptional regulator